MESSGIKIGIQFNPRMSIRQQGKITVRGRVHVINNSGNAAIYALVK